MVQFDQLSLVCIAGYSIKFGFKYWYGHIRRREEDNLSRNKMDMVLPGKRRRGGLNGDGLTTPGRI